MFSLVEHLEQLVLDAAQLALVLLHFLLQTGQLLGVGDPSAVQLALVDGDLVSTLIGLQLEVSLLALYTVEQVAGGRQLSLPCNERAPIADLRRKTLDRRPRRVSLR